MYDIERLFALAARYGVALHVHLGEAGEPHEIVVEPTPSKALVAQPRPSSGKRKRIGRSAASSRADDLSDKVVKLLASRGTMKKATIIHEVLGDVYTRSEAQAITAALTGLKNAGLVRQPGHGHWEPCL